MAAFDPKYYGVPPSQQIQKENRYNYTATSGQTTFSAVYTPGFGPDVYYNGAHLDPRFAFTATDGATVVLTNAADTGASVVIVAKAQVPNYNFYTQAETNALVQNFYAATTGGTASAITAVTTPSFTAWISDGQEVKVRMGAANTVTNPTIAFNGLTGLTIVRDGQQPLTGGDWNALDEVTLRYSVAYNNLTLTTGKLTAATPAPLNSTNAYATTAFANAAGSVIGTTRNLLMNITAAGTTATVTASELTVETSLGGAPFRIGNFNKTINLATTGAGGMDTGTAPVSGYVGLYAIFNPTSGVSALLAVNASTNLAEVYGGANMPSGYTASALLGVVPTNSSSQFIVGALINRKWFSTSVSVYNANGTVAGYTAQSAAAAVPLNAKRCSGLVTSNNTATDASGITSIAGSSTGVGLQTFSIITVQANGPETATFTDVPLLTPQTIYIAVSAATGTPGAQIQIVSYEI